ncbi:Glycosyltransferase involved in cell wall bisynthesis [Halopseudomonas litoralis]|uniref:Glycosyltransferase involved in cell wall bisynthesis n=1 Tax=Halopseudomonas litoralis TaxID=797277 RepID=A0A1H1S8L5_9GAMM|nr:glycosyltransferase [Halopseudomonas litoralis]SDS44138.1 Glycosyltransferase involved in cell wall bisynthesis [Halopseudomonas litoralis]
MKNNLICFLDKGSPPTHSFVDGILASHFPIESNATVLLFVSKDKKALGKPYRYLNAICLPVLYQRRGLGRILNFPLVFYLTLRYVRKSNATGRGLTVFVRNDPVFLSAVSALKLFYKFLVFQSSFPHEEYSGGAFKKFIARKLINLASPKVDSILGVSPAGVERIRKLVPQALKSAYIPLLPDEEFQLQSTAGMYVHAPLIFIYIGTHERGRGLDVVLKGIAAAVDAGLQAKFVFLGGAKHDIDQLLIEPDVEDLVSKEVLSFIGKVDRKEVPGYLQRSDVGLCLIPPAPVYYEASPTKLAEYMGSGLAVLANYGIPLQEQFVKESGSGILCDFDVLSISNSLMAISQSDIKSMKERSVVYSGSDMNYCNYIPVLKDLCGFD